MLISNTGHNRAYSTQPLRNQSFSGKMSYEKLVLSRSRMTLLICAIVNKKPAFGERVIGQKEGVEGRVTNGT